MRISDFQEFIISLIVITYSFVSYWQIESVLFSLGLVLVGLWVMSDAIEWQTKKVVT